MTLISERSTVGHADVDDGETRSNRITSLVLRVAPLATIAILLETGTAVMASGPRRI